MENKTLFVVNKKSTDALLGNLIQLLLQNDDYIFVDEKLIDNSVLDMIGTNIQSGNLEYKIFYFLDTIPKKEWIQSILTQYSNAGFIIFNNEVSYNDYIGVSNNVQIFNRTDIENPFIYNKLHELIKHNYIGTMTSHDSVFYHNLSMLINYYTLYIKNILNNVESTNNKEYLAYLTINKLLNLTTSTERNIIINNCKAYLHNYNIVTSNNIMDIVTIENIVNNLLLNSTDKSYTIKIDNPLDPTEIIDKTIYFKYINITSEDVSIFNMVNKIFKNITNAQDTFVCFYKVVDVVNFELTILPITSRVTPINFENELQVINQIFTVQKTNILTKFFMSKLPTKTYKINLNGTVSVNESLTNDEFKLLLGLNTQG